MLPSALRVLASLGLVVVGCGGNVVVDPVTSPGSSSTTASTGRGGGVAVSSSSSTGGAGGAGGTGGAPVGTSSTGGTGGAGGSPTGPFALVTRTIDMNPDGACANLLLFGQQPPADAAAVLVSNRPISCGATIPPEIANYATGGDTDFAWEVCILMTGSQLQPGALTLGSGTPWPAGYTESVDGAVPCEEGGGIMGQLTFQSVQSSTVTFSLAGTNAALGCVGQTITSDGTYVAPRCP